MKVKWIDNKLAISKSIDNYDNLYEIDYIINLRSEQHDDICELTKRKIGYFWLPIGDWVAPRADQINLCINLINYLNGTVLIHCAEGKGRTGTLATAYLLTKGKVKSIKDAYRYLLDKGIRIDLTDAQREKLFKHFRIKE